MKRLQPEQLNRLKLLLKRGGTLLLVGVLYLIFILIFKKGIPCIFYLLFDKYCPGCGITRMCVALARLDIPAAMSHNLLAFFLVPVLLVIFFCKAVGFVKTGSWKRSKLETGFYLVAFALCIVFTVLRNLSAYAYLAP